MSDRVTMPALGESVTEGTVTRWLKSVGDEVQVDEPLLEVSTDKVDTEIPSPFAGTLQEILVQEDETVPVGAELAVVGEGSAPSGSNAGESNAEQSDAEQSGGGQSGGGQEQAGAQSSQAQQGSEGGDTGAAGQMQKQADDVPATPSVEQPVAPETSEPESGQTQSGQAETAQPASLQESTQGPSAQGPNAQASTQGESGQRVKMPALGESVTEGTITRWLKAEGDKVEVDEPLLEVSTDKVDTEIPSPAAGVLTKILVGEDETVPVGAELAVLGGDASSSQQQASQQQAPEQAPEQQAPEQQAPEQQAPEQQAPEQAPQPEASQPAPEQQAPEPTPAAGSGDGDGSSDGSSYVTPLVRKLAAQHEVDLSSLKGTGVGGRIRKQDVLEAAEAAKAPPPQPQPAASLTAKRGTSEKMSRLRKVIAQRMVESLHVSAQLTTVIEVDLTRVARLRERAKKDFEAREGTKLSYLPFLALAAVEALKAHPNVNASVEGDEIVYHARENLSVAVDTEKGLIVPVVKDAGDLNIAGLARAIADVAERTRTNKITPDDLAGGTFTLTNTGSRGALFDTPIINQPQVAILGTGAVVKRPVVTTTPDGEETIAIRSMMYLALSYDHRIVDGADAARFLSTMKNRLEEGRFEASLGL